MAPASCPPIDSTPHRRPKLQLRVPSCPGRQEHATRVRWALPLPMRERRRVVAAGIAGNNNRRAILRAYIASLAERGEHNADKLTVDGLVYLKNLTSHKKKPVKRRA